MLSSMSWTNRKHIFHWRHPLLFLSNLFNSNSKGINNKAKVDNSEERTRPDISGVATNDKVKEQKQRELTGENKRMLFETIRTNIEDQNSTCNIFGEL